MTKQGRSGATLLGCIAILFWSALALLTVGARGIPPFELLALSFGVAFLAGMVMLALRGRSALARLRQPVVPWMVAFLGLFLYHALYFFSLSTIPPARASLIAYLWPLLIVVFAAVFPGGAGLRLRHLLGAVLGLAGTALILMDHSKATMSHGINDLGYLAAFGCAFVWSGYSVLNRQFAAIPSEMLVGVCAAVSLAGGIVHGLLEPTIWPSTWQWGAILLLGIGPTGLAFLAWDYATKNGNLTLLGALSYFAPLLSTLLLVLAGKALANINLALAALLIVGGAVIASRNKKLERLS